jgi:ribosomal protein S19
MLDNVSRFAAKRLAQKEKAKRKPPQLEKHVKDAVKRVLAHWGAYQLWPVPTGYGARTLDCVACIPMRVTPEMVGKTIGVFVGVETKRPGVRAVTRKQADTMRQMREAGAFTCMVNTTSVDEVEDTIIPSYGQFSTFKAPLRGNSHAIKGQLGSE